MSEVPAKTVQSQRLMSLDAFRGMTIAGMLLVNNPGSWSHIYWPLDHALWNGWTFTDLIFPFFLFIVGVAMVFSFNKRIEAGEGRGHLFGHVVRRSVVLMLLGYSGAVRFFLPPVSTPVGWDGVTLRVGCALILLGVVVLLAGTTRPRRWGAVLAAGVLLAVIGGLSVGANDPLWRTLVTSRWPGVLVRIGVCYLLASGIIFLSQNPKVIIGWIVALLAVYWIWIAHTPVPPNPTNPSWAMPDLSIPVENEETGGFSGLFSNWEVYVDFHVFGIHNYQTIPPRDEVSPSNPVVWGFDPEGLPSTMGAVCTVLLGFLTGQWLRRRDKTPVEKTAGMFVVGTWLLFAGLLMSIDFPINKKIWTSSYVVFMAGMALVILAMCYHTIDVRRHRRWLMPFVWFGTNAITAFYFSGMMAVLLGRLTLTVGGERMSWHGFFHSRLLVPWAGDLNGSLLFAICFVLVWTAIMGILHRWRIFLKI